MKHTRFLLYSTLSLILTLALHAYERSFTTYADYAGWTGDNAGVVSNDETDAYITLGTVDNFDYESVAAMGANWTVTGHVEFEGDGIARLISSTNSNVSLTHTKTFRDPNRVVTVRQDSRYLLMHIKDCGNGYLMRVIAHTNNAGSDWKGDKSEKVRMDYYSPSYYPFNDAGISIPSFVKNGTYNVTRAVTTVETLQLFYDNTLLVDTEYISLNQIYEFDGGAFVYKTDMMSSVTPTNRLDRITIIDTNTGYIISPRINNTEARGMNDTIFNAYVTASENDMEGVTYTYKVNTHDNAHDDTNWITITPGKTVAIAGGSNQLYLMVEVALSGFDTFDFRYDPFVKDISFFYNTYQVLKSSFAKNDATNGHYEIDYRFSDEVDNDQFVDVRLYDEDGIAYDMGNAASVYKSRSNEVRAIINVSTYNESAASPLSHGVYSVGISNVTGRDGSLRLEKEYRITNNLVYTAIDAQPVIEEDAFYPPVISKTAGSETSLYVHNGERFNRVTVVIYDTHGILMRTLVEEEYFSGTAVFTWDGTDDGGTPVRNGRFFAHIKKGYATSVCPIYVFRK